MENIDSASEHKAFRGLRPQNRSDPQRTDLFGETAHSLLLTGPELRNFSLIWTAGQTPVFRHRSERDSRRTNQNCTHSALCAGFPRSECVFVVRRQVHRQIPIACSDLEADFMSTLDLPLPGPPFLRDTGWPKRDEARWLSQVRSIQMEDESHYS
jgi:hypothetical protein